MKKVECEETTDPHDQYPVLADAWWELKENWDCPGNDIGSIGTFVMGKEIVSRAGCAAACLEAANCVAFNYPQPGTGTTLNGNCWWKHTNQESTKLGKTCGSSKADLQYYTLLDKNSVC